MVRRELGQRMNWDSYHQRDVETQVVAVLVHRTFASSDYLRRCLDDWPGGSQLRKLRAKGRENIIEFRPPPSATTQRDAA